MSPVSDLWRSVPEAAWTEALDVAAAWADRSDRSASRRGDSPEPAADRSGPGMAATLWAGAKASAGIATMPLTLPALTIAALGSARRIGDRIDAFPDHLIAISNGSQPVLPGPRTTSLASSERYLITSDLHRCIAGRLDWPQRQGVKGLYAEVLGGYAQDGWHLIENGDVEDFWMVGGSTWGAVYDVAYLTGATIGPRRVEARRTLLGEHLARIVANNAEVYGVLRDGFAADGRYHRTMGNHDDVFADDVMVERLAEHLGNVEVADTILLRGADSDDPAERSIASVEAVIAHGHLTDSWNGHDVAALGRSITWLATGLDDLPRGGRSSGLPDPGAIERLLNSGAANRLIAVDPRFGGNRRLDSLDEVRLFERLDERAPDGGWPWLVHGHTHFPMLSPLDPNDRPVRYANSGCGVLRGGFTALEWDASDPEHPLRLVLWRREGGRAVRTELVPDGDALRVG